MALIRFVCPHCEKPVTVQVAGVTRSRSCPECGKSVMLQVGSRESKRRALLVNEQQPEPLISGATGDGSLVKDSLVLEKQVIQDRVAKRSTEVIFAMANKEDSSQQTPTAAAVAGLEAASASSLPAERYSTSTSHVPARMSGPAYEPQNLQGDAFQRMKLDPEIAAIRQKLRLGIYTTVTLIILITAINYYLDLNPQKQPMADRRAAPQVDPATPMPENAVGLKRSDQTQPNNTKLKLDAQTLDMGVTSNGEAK